MLGKLCWIIVKDLLSERRARRVWPAMLLFGALTTILLAVQMDLPAEGRHRIAGGMLWLAVCFAGMLTLDRSFAGEREDGCWEALLLYPVSTTTIYFAKLAVNVVALAALQCVLVPLFAAMAGVPLLAHPGAIALTLILGILGIAAVGTLLSALSAGIRQGANLLPLLVLPLVIPVVLAAAEATRLTVAGDFSAPWQNWIQLLAAFAAIFTAAGAVLFDFAIED